MSIYEQIDALLARPGMTQTAFAKEIGVAQATVARWVSRSVSPEGRHRDRIRELYSETLLQEATAAGAPAPNASFPPQYQRFPTHASVPLLGQTVAGANGRFVMNGQEVDRLFCPPNLAGVEGAYAVRIYGTSGEPRFMAGETAWIDPTAPVRSGDDVVVQILGNEGDPPSSYVKRFVSLSGKRLRLYQYNPDEGEKHELEFDADRVFSIHKIVFHAMV